MDRYYYAIAECDTVQTASHLYSELQGAELERSANVMNLSFVPDDMTFEEEYRLRRPDVFCYRLIEFTGVGTKPPLWTKERIINPSTSRQM